MQDASASTGLKIQTGSMKTRADNCVQGECFLMSSVLFAFKDMQHHVAVLALRVCTNKASLFIFHVGQSGKKSGELG